MKTTTKDKMNQESASKPLTVEQVELLPCPFCGSTKVELIEAWREWSVVCHGCHIGTGHSPSTQVVTDCWNRRALAEPERDELARHLDGEHHAIVAQQIDSPMNACMFKETCLWLKRLATPSPERHPWRHALEETVRIMGEKLEAAERRLPSQRLQERLERFAKFGLGAQFDLNPTMNYESAWTLGEGFTKYIARMSEVVKELAQDVLAPSPDLDGERRDAERLRGVLEELVNALEAEASAKIAADVAIDNFTDPQSEVDKCARAMVRASGAMKTARAAIAAMKAGEQK